MTKLITTILFIFLLAGCQQPLGQAVPEVLDTASLHSKFQLATKIQERYNLSDTKLTTKIEHLDDIKVEIGEVGEFKPNMEISRWDGEVKMKIKPRLNTASKKKELIFDKEKINYKEDKKEYHLYEIADGYEYEIILLEKPATNTITLDIETKGLNFYYQPELTQQEKDEGCKRPENVVGSYAVYHESKQGDYSKMGMKNYRAGKAFHIYRPKIIDNVGTEVWGELNIENGILSVTIPQDFLDNAVYPVRHAAGLTFGHDTKGGTRNTQGNDFYASWFALSEAGTPTSITNYLEQSFSNTPTFSFSIHTKTSSVSGALQEYTSEWTLTSGWDNWKTLNLTGTPSSLLSGNYWLGMWASGHYYVYYDTVADRTCYNLINYNYPNFPDPLNGSGPASTRYSIYCTYTASGGAARRIFTTD